MMVQTLEVLEALIEDVVPAGEVVREAAAVVVGAEAEEEEGARTVTFWNC